MNFRESSIGKFLTVKDRNMDYDHVGHRLKIPGILAGITHEIFLGLEGQKGSQFATHANELLKVRPLIHTDAKLDLVWPKFAKWLLTELSERLVDHRIKTAIASIVQLFKYQLAGGTVTPHKWEIAQHVVVNAGANVIGGACELDRLISSVGYHCADTHESAIYLAAEIMKPSFYETMADKLIYLLQNS